jgi:iron-sulfur cluster repair protein YtfE (RIC family)
MLLHIHDSFRRASAELVSLAEQGADSLPRLRRQFSPLLHALHHHHEAEEQMLFPLVRARTGDHPGLLVDEHDALMKRLAEVSASLQGGEMEAIGRTLRVLDEELRAHLDREESIAIPVLLELTHAEATRILYGSR